MKYNLSYQLSKVIFLHNKHLLWMQLSVLFISKHQLTYIPARNVCVWKETHKNTFLFCLPSVLGLPVSSTLYSTCAEVHYQVTDISRCVFRCLIMFKRLILQRLHLLILLFAPCVQFLKAKLLTNRRAAAVVVLAPKCCSHLWLSQQSFFRYVCLSYSV